MIVATERCPGLNRRGNLSPGAPSTLKVPVLPSKLVLVGKGYMAAGQAFACLHTMSVLQAYQADLLK